MLTIKPFSSAIHSLEFNKETNELGIVFRGTLNVRYIYSNVSRQRLTSAMHSDSLGSYFQRIRSNPETFPFRKEVIN